MRQWRKVTACSDGTLLRNAGKNTTLQHREKRADDLHTATAEPQSQHVRPQQHHGARFSFRERMPESAGVAANKIQLQPVELGRWNPDVRQFAKAGVDP